MRGLFEANNHSQFNISFVKVQDEVKETVLKITPFFEIQDPAKIEQVKELELNSNNFKICCNNQTILLRKHISNNTIDKVALELQLQEFLLQRKVVVSKPIRSRDGKLLVEYAGYCYSAYEFINGAHYAGSYYELKQAAYEIAKLHQALRDAPFQDEISEHFTFLTNPYSFELLNEIAVRAGLDTSIDQLFKSNQTLIQNSLEEVQATKALMFSDEQIIHGDLHPHNFLFEHGKLRAILDFGEMRRGSLLEDLAFSLHRLSRQLIVNQTITTDKEIRKSIARSYQEFVNGYENAGLNFERIKRNLIPTMIKHIALKKLFTILKANYLEQNPRWNFDLLKHLNSLKEASFYVEV